jgi:hypothetical protein
MRKGSNGEDDQPWTDLDDVWRTFLEPVNRMSRDIRRAAALLGPDEVRHLVDAYYIMQEDRKRAKGQERALDASGEPHSVISWLFAQSGTLEKQIRSALDVYTENHVMGSWMRQIYGIGPVISAGLLAHIHMGYWCQICHGHEPADCEARQKDPKLEFKPHNYLAEISCPTVGHIWSFAGWAADQQTPWEKGQKRPFNAKLKVLCWKAGQSFMKFSNQPECFYGRIYRERKDYEMAKNERLEYAQQAAVGAKRVARTTEAYKYYSINKLPPGHIDARARRYAVKLFLAHLHGEWYQRQFGKPAPLPYPIAHLGHVHVTPSLVPAGDQAHL